MRVCVFLVLLLLGGGGGGGLFDRYQLSMMFIILLEPLNPLVRKKTFV